MTVIFSEKGFQIVQEDGLVFSVLPSGHKKPHPDANSARQFIVEKMKAAGVYGKGSFGNAFANGAARARQEIANKMSAAGLRVENAGKLVKRVQGKNFPYVIKEDKGKFFIETVMGGYLGTAASLQEAESLIKTMDVSPAEKFRF